jgi:capsular exopolysaccharide synthesis family protein
MTLSDPGLGRGQGGAEWRRPRTETPPLQRYLQIFRERLRMIVAVVLVTTLAAIAYLAVATKVYEAEADLLVTPVSAQEDPALTGLGLIRESSDPTRDVETAARLVTSRDVAQRARTRLRLRESVESLQSKVSAAPVAQSNIVAVTARADDPKLARDLANAFSGGVVAKRSEQLRRQLDVLIPRLAARIRAGGGGTGAGSLSEQLSTLQSLRAGGDPTLRLETRAHTPTSAVSPRPVLTLAAGILAGLILGVGGAFAMHAMDPRLRREEQLRESYGLPILARIPNEKRASTTVMEPKRIMGIGPHRKHRRALAPGQLSAATLRGYKTLRAMLAATTNSRPQGRSMLVTGPSPSEGKTTTAINLAASLALAGNRVILVEADFRRPAVGEALDLKPRHGIGKVLLGNVLLEDALVPTKPFGENLRVLLVDRTDDWLAEVLSLPAAGTLLNEAEQLADFVVVDSPPLTEVIDALPLAQQVDNVLVVVRLGYSNLGSLSRLGDMLEQNEIKPTGFVVVGVGSSDEESYYLRSRRERTEELFEQQPERDRERAILRIRSGA